MKRGCYRSRFKIGDAVRIDTAWTAVITAITFRASGEVEYQLEWRGDGLFKSEWFSAERMDLVGITLIEGQGQK